MNKLLRTSLYTMVAIIAVGCSTPNVNTFVNETLQINNLAISEHSEIKSKLEYLSTVHRKKKLEIAQKMKEFSDSSKKLEKIFSLLVGYSNSINVLVGDETDGENAIAEISDNLSEISQLLNIGGVSIDIGGVVNTVTNLITEIQKQKELEKAMAFAEPIIKKISTEISDNYSITMINMTNNIADLLIGSLDDRYPINAVGFYTKAIDHKNIIYQDMRSRLEATPDGSYTVLCSSHDNSNCITKDTIEAFNQVNSLIDSTKPIYDAYIIEVKNIKNCEKGRKIKFKNLATLSKVWAKEHSKVLGILRNCNSINMSCEDLDGINIIDIVKQ